MDNHIAIDLYKEPDGSIVFEVANRNFTIDHNPMIPQAASEIVMLCKKYNLNGFVLYLDPITSPPEPDD